MILIVDNTQRIIRKEIRKELFSRCIPCAITDILSMDKYFPCNIVIVTEGYIFDDVKYMADIYECSRVVLYDEREELLAFILRVYYDYCREHHDISYFLRFKDELILYSGMPLRLTLTQRMIVKRLLYHNGWVTKDALAHYCLLESFADTGAISVHVSNINKAAKDATGLKLIEFKRFSGYRIFNPNAVI